MKALLTLTVTLATGVTVLLLAQAAQRRPEYWSATELRKTVDSELTSKARASGLGTKSLVNTPTHAIFEVVRAKAFAEAHEFDTDIFIVQGGEGTLQVGGEIVDRRTSGPGQFAGSSIRGGEMTKASAGDVFYIPKNVPHQWHIREGQQVTYLAMKVTEK